MKTRKKPKVTLPGTVEKIIPTRYSSEPEKVEISVDGADPLYQEIRIENKLEDEEGMEVGLKPGAQVEVTIEAAPDAITTREPERSDQEAKAEAGNGQKQ